MRARRSFTQSAARLVTRSVSVVLTAAAFGLGGGGLGGLGSGTQKVGKPSAGNPIVWVAEKSDRESAKLR